MKISYDPEADILRILLSQSPIEESDEDKPGVILDYDVNGNLVGVELLDASTRTDKPQALEFMVGA